MTIYELEGRGLLLHSVVALDEARMRELEALGEPRVMIVPSGLHRLDAGVYKERYPRLLVLCPARARARVEKVVRVDGACEERLDEPGVGIVRAAGLKPLELVYELDIGERGKALVVNDAMFNVRGHWPGLSGFVFRYLTKSTGFFGVTGLSKLVLMADTAAFAAWLREQSQRSDLGAIIVSHGDPITERCSERLREAAERL